MVTTIQQERPVAVTGSAYRFEREVTSGFERVATRHRDLSLSSMFQPIFSLSHQRAVGYEGLLRAHDALDRVVAPVDVFGEAARHGDVMLVDRLAQALHLENFSLLGAAREWLFLNVHPGVLTDQFQTAALLANLKRLGISPRRVVLEVLEQRADDLDRLAEAVKAFREHGFLIALDDFGAGHSNIERIWQLNPDIVKLDRIMLSHAQHRSGQTAILHGLVTLLHEAGKLVLIEGIETEHDAQVALACEADFVQGYFFGRPAPGLADGATASACIGELTERYRSQTEARERRDAQRIAPYLRAFERAAERLSAGESLDEVCWNFLSLDDAARCFLLDAQGRQADSNVVRRADRALHEMRFAPLSDAQGANWLRRPYFRAAIAEPQRVHVTRPYLSINEALPCVTLSIAIRIADSLCVLCGDIDWPEAGPAG
ncbi:Cyclic diguanylate phosphodiesterase [Burkholderia glumae BGR1]|nr:EAL domain-containing protein [Burkholderia glumae]ACR30315.1 Cyclic diguanylate phosphodiesterase [Burkholderia glumae BGR1]KHJ62301.1 diguanylate phosphodiesterase [Burkholderia glumae]QJP72923.1 EAL domain-containing protein [Burkholderia glumae]QKM52700.1 Putative cyclic-di-GMP phosphodiesterase YjcC [Burkholderia glumae]QTP34286.1 Putative cyclic-di-GMP phosphodiesterase YjcC [Burkholderia glumae]